MRLMMFIHGAVRLSVSGGKIETFMNLCMEQNLKIWGLRSSVSGVAMWIGLRDFFLLRSVVSKSGVKVRVIRRYGIPFFWQRCLKRKVLAGGGMLLFVILGWLSTYMWFVEIKCDDDNIRELVKVSLSEQGIAPGISKERINCRELEKLLMADNPAVAWAGVQLNGTKLSVEVVQKLREPLLSELPGDIIAQKTGIITECVTIQGKCLVKRGDKVQKGDILIKGINMAGEPIRANGIIRAQLEYDGVGSADFYQPVYQLTGREARSVSVKLVGRTVRLYTSENCFETYEAEQLAKKFPWWRNQPVIVEFNIDTYRELMISEMELNYEKARQNAFQTAIQSSSSQIPQEAVIIDQRVWEESYPDRQQYVVKSRVETREDIGRLQEFN